jgi:hypothetical protein
LTVASIVIGALGLLCTVIIGVLVKVLSDDARTAIPKISASIVLRAARQLPGEVQNRYREEWLAALGETNERSVMLAHAIGCFFFAAPRICAELGETRSFRSLVTKAFPEVDAAERKRRASVVLAVDEVTVDTWLAGTGRPNWRHRAALRLLVAFEALLRVFFGKRSTS